MKKITRIKVLKGSPDLIGKTLQWINEIKCLKHYE